MAHRLHAIAEESCWRCGSWGHWASECSMYVEQSRLAERWRERYETEPPWLRASGPVDEREET